MKPTERIWIAVIISLAVVIAIGSLTFRIVDTPSHRSFDYGTRPFVPGKSRYAVEPYEHVELPRPESTRPRGGEGRPAQPRRPAPRHEPASGHGEGH